MSAISFQGITSGMQTDQLVAAIIAQAGLPVQHLKDRQTLNTQRSTALKTMQSDMTSLASSLATMQYTGFAGRSVSSSDSNGSYVTATASGAQSGNYDLLVTSVATKGRILPATDGSVLGVADPTGGGTSQVFTTGTPASFAVQGTDGVVKVITLNDSNNSLYGLRDAINGSGAGVTASVVNTGSGDKPYQLVLTADDTGTGKTSGVVTLADVTKNDGATPANNLGISAGTVDSLTTPTSVSGGLRSAAATDAVFSVNGIQLTRTTNVVTDAVDGVTFNLKQGQTTTTPTTLTVTQDKSSITSAMQDVISKYNTLMSDYKTASTATKASDGSILPGALSNDSTARSIISQVQSAFRSIPSGLSDTASYHSVGDLGIKASSDGTLSLDVTAFQKALDADPEAAKNVFAFSGTTTSGVATFLGGGTATATGDVAFNITTYDSSTGSWSGTVGGVSVTGSKDGSLSGTTGTAIEGLQLSVTGLGSGTLTLTKGVGQATQDVVSNLTAYNGTFWNTLASIDQQNTSLTTQIESGQSLLDKREAALKLQFSQMEATLSQMRSISGSLTSA